MSLPDVRYHRVALAAFPGVELPAAFDAAGQRLYFPVATVCAALQLDTRSQRARLRRDYATHVQELRLPTAGGPQDLLCVEYEALALWLATVQDGKAGEGSRERIRAFRAQVMAAASDILMGRMQAVPLDARRQNGRDVTSLLLQTEGRIAALERAVFVGEPTEHDAGAAVARCPHCGGPIRVTVGTIEVVAEWGDE